ncbi:MAG: hypothetical protein ABI873_01450 [Marmoricola sp.]
MMAPESVHLDRRALLVGGTAGLLTVAGCASGTGASRSGSTAAPGSSTRAPKSPGPSATLAESAAPSPSASPVPAPSRIVWRPDAGDVDPAAKHAAVRVVEAIGTWDSGGEGLRAAARRVAALGQPRRLASLAGTLTGAADEAVVRVVDAQTGGLLSSSASILVVCRQWRRTGTGGGHWGGTTVDVRLVLRLGRWQVTELHPARPGPAARSPSDLQRRVLSSSRIVLPPAAMADVRSGNVHVSVLRAMLALSADFRIGVSVVRSGHPTYVFGTGRPSDHPQGRAFDTFRIDGRLVVDPATPQALVTRFMEAAARAGSYNVGGPYRLSGAGNLFFSDATHHDHVHAGFTS